MALPVWQALGSIAGGTVAQSPAWPSHQAGDIGLLFVESTGGQTPSLTTPAGFTLLAQINTGATTSGTRLQIYWCRATSGAMGAPTVSNPGNHVMGIIGTIRGARAEDTPIAAYASSVKASASTSITFPSVTTPLNDCLILYCAARDNDNAAAAFSSASGGNTANIAEEIDTGSIAGNGGGFGVYSGELALLGASGTLGATVTSSINAMITIAIAPETFVATGWDSPLDLTVDNTQVDADLTDFPVYVDLSDMPSDFWSNVQADGGDIRITDSNGKLCAIELVTIDTGAETGELHFKAPSLANSSDTDFSVYFGHATAEQPSDDCAGGQYDVWDANFTGVYHMEGNPAGGAPQCLDSTRNARHGTTRGTMGSGQVQTPGKLAGQAYEFIPTDDAVEISGNMNMNVTGKGTVMFWLDSDAVDLNGGSPWGSDVLSIADRFTFRQESGNSTVFYHNGSGWQGIYSNTPNLVGAGWTYWAAKIESGAQKVWHNSTVKGTNTISGAITFSGGLTAIGDHAAGGNPYNADGHMDEVRFSDNYRSDGFVTTTYNNQNSPSTFYTISTPSTPVTVNPSVLGLSANLGAPTVRIPKSVSPSVLTAIASLGSPAVKLGARISPSPLGLVAALQAPTVNRGWVVSPSVFALTMNLGAPSLSLAWQASPSVLTLTAALNDPTVSLPKSVSPDTLDVTVTLNDPSVSVRKTVSPNVLALIASLNAPSLSLGWVASPATLALTVNLGAPTIKLDRTLFPAVLGLTASMQTPAVALGWVAMPAVLALTASMQAATVEGDANVDAEGLELTVALNDPSVGVSKTISPSVLDLIASLGAPSIFGGAVVSPAALIATVSLNAPSFSLGRTVSASLLSLTASLQDPDVNLGHTAIASVLTLTTSLNAPSFSLGLTVSPALLSITASLNAPAVRLGWTASATLLTLSANLGTPSVRLGNTVSPAVLALIASLNAPGISGEANVAPGLLTLTASLGSPVVRGAAQISPGVLSLIASLNAPTVKYGTAVHPSPLTLTVSLIAPGISIVTYPALLTLTVNLNTPTIFFNIDLGEIAASLTIAVRDIIATRSGAADDMADTLSVAVNDIIDARSGSAFDLSSHAVAVEDIVSSRQASS